MLSGIARQIDSTHFPIAQRAFFVHEIIHADIATEHHLAFGIHVVQRCAQPSVHIGHVRDNLPELLEADAGKFHGHFLISNGIFAVGIEMDAGALLIEQADIAKNASTVGQVDVVPLIQLERAVYQGRIFREQLHANAPASEGRIQAQIDAFLLLFVEVLQENLRLSITDISVQIYFERFLFWLRGADDFSQEIQSVGTMLQVDAEGVYG